MGKPMIDNQCGTDRATATTSEATPLRVSGPQAGTCPHCSDRILTCVARCGHPHGGGLGRVHWVDERTHVWLHDFCRLRIRFERRADIHEALLNLAAA